MYSYIKSKTESCLRRDSNIIIKTMNLLCKPPTKSLSRKRFYNSARRLLNSKSGFIDSGFWRKKSGSLPDLKSDSNTVSHEIKIRSGESCLDMYNDILNHRTTFPVGRSIMIKKELEYHGANFFDWVNVKSLNEELNKYVNDNVWVKYIASGSFTSVHLFMNKETSSFSVLKLQKYSQNMDSETSAKIHLQEIKALKELKHENIIKIYDYGIFRERYWLTLDFADLGSVGDLVFRYKKKKTMIEFDLICKCIKNVLEGLRFIHENKIIHRDIKCDNILVFSDNSSDIGKKFKIGDFNLSRTISSFSPFLNSYCGTVTTIAPEMVSKEPYNHKIDIWSFMCVLIEMIRFQSLNPLSIDVDQLEKRIIGLHDDVILKFILFMHVKNPEKRPDAEDLLEYFNNQLMINL